MRLHILREAEDELSEAIQYYEDITPGLGIRLKHQVKQALYWIENNHELPSVRPNGYRRLNCRSFPYYIAYVVKDAEIFIVAIANASRSPEYWIKRTCG
ncbi:MAG: type II toxin-antitoxin system RelE/ParE family toxin [Terrimicrobiaceae bacterium]